MNTNQFSNVSLSLQNNTLSASAEAESIPKLQRSIIDKTTVNFTTAIQNILESGQFVKNRANFTVQLSKTLKSD